MTDRAEGILKHIRTAVGVLFIAWLGWFFHTRRVLDAFQGLQISYLILFAMVVNADRLVMAYKWNLLLRAKSIRIDPRELIAIYYRSTIGVILLGALAGDTVRIVDTSRQAADHDDVISSVVIERVLGALALIAVVLFGIMLTSSAISFADSHLIGMFGGLLVLAAVSFIYFLRAPWLAALASRISRSENPVVKHAGAIIASCQQYSEHRMTLIAFYFLSLGEQLVPAGYTYLIARALGLQIPLAAFLAVVPMISAVLRMPISSPFDGFGINEVLHVYLLGIVGIEPNQAFLTAFLTHVFGVLAVSPGILIAVFRKQSSKWEPIQRLSERVMIGQRRTPLEGAGMPHRLRGLDAPARTSDDSPSDLPVSTA